MAGSQLKQLKAALKESGLTGQTNSKKKSNSKKAPSDTRRDDKQEVIQRIREQFNPFEIKLNRKKNDIEKNTKGAQGRPGISKQIGEDSRKAAYEAKKARKNKNSTLLDRRFGERDSTLTPEERMLERFTRERQTQSSKSGLFNLGDSDDDSNDAFGDGLTHYGKSLSLKDDFAEDDLQNPSDEDDDFLKPKKRSYDDTIDTKESEDEPHGIPKKKTKAEVMKEVIAKSKFYKQQRQTLQDQVEGKIHDLDDEYQDVLEALGSVPKPKPGPQFAAVSNDPKAINYEQSVRELNLDRRAAPADRTKTDEEIRLERAKKMRELEDARLRRMEGVDSGVEKGPDDLDDDFWVQGSDNEEDGFALEGGNESPEELDDEGSDASAEDDTGPTVKKVIPITCPQSHDELVEAIKEISFEKTLDHINKIISSYAPRLQVGNKEKLAILTVILFQHVLYLSESEYTTRDEFPQVQEDLIKLVKQLSEKYNNELTEALRDKIEEIHERIQDTISGEDEFPRISDLTFFALIGLIYSTSDHYHLVVTPTSIIMGEALEQVKFDSLNRLISGAFIAETFLTYQRISKRYVPEVLFFLQKALLSILPTKIIDESIGIIPDEKFSLPKTLPNEFITLKLSDAENEVDTEKHIPALFNKLISIVELALDTWKDKTALVEISQPLITILNQFESLYPNFKPLANLSLKFNRLLKFSTDERKPLTLQSHKKLAIASYAPKFEENFNPEKRSYDNDRQRQDISKMRAQFKQERKITLRELRKDSRFEARQQIQEKKSQYQDYHAKMASILNKINTVEGAEKNEYNREKKLRKSKK